MTKRKTYDMRTVEDILATARFAPYRQFEGIGAVPKRELRTLDRFLAWAEETGEQAPGPEGLLAFSHLIGSKRALLDLRLAFGKFLPADAAIREVVREAILLQRPRSRRCDWRRRAEISAGAHFDPYRDLDGFDAISLEDLRVLDRFLVFAEAEGVEIPSEADFLRFSQDVTSNRRLRSLEAAFLKILPGNPAVVLTLRAAVERKAGPRPKPRPRKERPAKFSVPYAALPMEWRKVLERLRSGDPVNNARPLSANTLQNMEEILRSYALTLSAIGWPVTLSVTGVRLHEDALHARDAAPATLFTTTMRLRQFAVRLGEDAGFVDVLKVHENTLRRACSGVIKLKEARLDALPDLKRSWLLAHDLLTQSLSAKTRSARTRLRNEAFCIAFWTLIPLRLGDGCLRWGKDISLEEDRYRIDIVTGKEDVPLRGRLHPGLVPFLDAMILIGVDPDYVDEMRAMAFKQGSFVLRASDGRALAASYPSDVWREHMGTGAHIARSRIHSELGRLGPEGVVSALALCAQADPETRHHYQSRRLHDELMDRGQELVDGLFDEIAQDLV